MPLGGDRAPARRLVARGRADRATSASPTSTATSAASSSGACSRSSQHPNADRLRVCQVDVGEGDARQIVCGAWNFERRRDGRGRAAGRAASRSSTSRSTSASCAAQLSRGMILAEDEVGLGDGPRRDHGAPRRARAGDAARRRAADRRRRARRRRRPCNRVDLLSMVGLAREVAALFDGELAARPTSTDPPIVDDEPVDVADRGLRAAARATSAASSATSRSARRRSGSASRLHPAEMRPISNVVDVTNYVMHVSAARCTRSTARSSRAAGSSSGARVRRRELRTLDGVDRELDRPRPPDRRRGAGGRARGDHGRRGDARSRSATTSVLLEAANFEPIGILRTLRAARGCARRARTAGRRASTRTSPSRPRSSRAACSSTSPARAGRARRRARRAPERPVVALPPRARERADRSRGRPSDEQRAILERLGFERRRRTGTSPFRPGARAT